MSVSSRMLPILVGGIALSWLLPAAALACRCLPPPSPNFGLEKSDVVFVGKATDVEMIEADGWLYGTFKQMMGSEQLYEFETLRVTLEVTTPLKAADESPLILETLASQEQCGIPFQTGKEYFVYAYHSPQGDLKTDMCTRTATVAKAAEDMAVLVEKKERSTATRVRPPSP